MREAPADALDAPPPPVVAGLLGVDAVLLPVADDPVPPDVPEPGVGGAGEPPEPLEPPGARAATRASQSVAVMGSPVAGGAEIVTPAEGFVTRTSSVQPAAFAGIGTTVTLVGNLLRSSGIVLKTDP